MPRDKRKITRDDIWPLDRYIATRKELRAEAVALKKNRRMAVGPDATFYFESYDTMWHQIHEMLYIEKGGEEQIASELAAFNPLVPNGAELIATLMFEIDDEARRARVLAKLGGVEKTVRLKVGEHIINAVAEEDVERTDETGKASSVHFLHFPFTPEAVKAFRSDRGDVILAIEKDGYRHMAAMPAAVRQALSADFG